MHIASQYEIALLLFLVLAKSSCQWLSNGVKGIPCCSCESVLCNRLSRQDLSSDTWCTHKHALYSATSRKLLNKAFCARFKVQCVWVWTFWHVHVSQMHAFVQRLPRWQLIVQACELFDWDHLTGVATGLPLKEDCFSSPACLKQSISCISWKVSIACSNETQKATLRLQPGWLCVSTRHQDCFLLES